MTLTAMALAGYIGWTLFLVVTLVVKRSVIVMKTGRAATSFAQEAAEDPPILNRITRAYANCYESFPIVGGILILALVTDGTQTSDSVAIYLLAARIAQSIVHLCSTSLLAVQIRFAFFVVQLVLSAYLLYALVV